jgi:hypothetical protein
VANSKIPPITDLKLTQGGIRNFWFWYSLQGYTSIFTATMLPFFISVSEYLITDCHKGQFQLRTQPVDATLYLKMFKRRRTFAASLLTAGLEVALIIGFVLGSAWKGADG